MKILPDWLKAGYLRLIEPVADGLVRYDVHPNTITTVGTLCTIAGGVLYGLGRIRLGGWLLGVTALFDVLDGMVAASDRAKLCVRRVLRFDARPGGRWVRAGRARRVLRDALGVVGSPDGRRVRGWRCWGRS